MIRLVTRERNTLGFTLIELLIVIVIIGILAGVVISIINPAQVQRKAREATMRANVDKYCTALYACASTRLDPLNDCNSFAEIGATEEDGIPVGADYYVWSSSPHIFARGILANVDPQCYFLCYYNTSDGVSSGIYKATWGTYSCLID